MKLTFASILAFAMVAYIFTVRLAVFCACVFGICMFGAGTYDIISSGWSRMIRRKPTEAYAATR
jgi:hypothetical protein